MPDKQLPEPGCYVDSHWGQYAMARAVQIALEFGWKDAEAEALAYMHLKAMGPSTEPELTGEQFERLVSACDDAESWLNDNRAPEGYAWSWNDGDFGLYALEDEDA